ncbi:MAG: fatty acid--CoA ligase [Acidimicrobiales bacterium]|nr:fatty acid--CoA ligase [Acidimicrobiales bacterium]
MSIGTVAELIRTHGRDRAGQPALLVGERTITYGQLDERSSRVAQALQTEGVGPHDRVAILDKNVPEYFDLLFGGAKLNAVLVAVNWRLAPPEVAYIVNDAQAAVLVVGEELVPVLEAIEGELTTVRKIVVIGSHDRHESYDDWAGRFDPADPGVVPQGGDVAFQLYSSGTTGRPKGVMLTNDNLFALLPLASQIWGFGPDSVNLVAMPLFHIGGSGWAAVGLYYGCASVLVREVNPVELVTLVPAQGITHAFLVPAVLQFMLGVPGVHDADWSRLRTIVYGASPISTQVLADAVRTFGCDFVQAYGLTETTGAIVNLPAADHDPDGANAHRLRAAGLPGPGVELRVVDPATGDDVATGTVGEIWVRGPQNMKGYWNLPDETAKAFVDGWFRTGDAGYLDDDGYVYIHDRVKDMIVSGGENVYPAEVENVLMAHPAVADVAVIGVPDERWGETPKAVVVAAPGATVGGAELIAYCREHLAHYKCPTSVDVVEVIPRNPSGKILKRELREPYWAGRERRVN